MLFYDQEFKYKRLQKKGVFFYAVSFLNKFRVYFGRLELLIEGYLDNDEDVIKSIEFGV